MKRIVKWPGLAPGKYHDWKARFGQANQHNGLQPRHFWLVDWEREAIVAFATSHPQEGYRRLAYMMLDADVVAVSPSSVYRVLKAAGLLQRPGPKASGKGSGFRGPVQAHQHWHIDISYLNIAGTFYYLSAVLDGYSRYLVHWEIRERMLEQDIEIILQRAQEHYPQARPRIISDNGPQFIAKDFKEYIRLMGMTHVRTSPFYPQSNGKLERWHKSLKSECIRPRTPVSLVDAQRLVSAYVNEYNNERLHSAIGYITPRDKLEGRAESIFAQRRQKLESAVKARSKVYEQRRQGQAA
ncbi:MAG: IS3 family transposase [Pseudomonadota bacterium]